MLITNLALANRSGTEVVTEQFADGLRRAGHEAAVLAPTIGDQGMLLRRRGVSVIERLDQLPWKPDVIHGHQNVTTMAALAALPSTPAVYVCHDAASAYDAPPLHPRIRAYAAVDELCRRRLISGGVKPDAISLLPNTVDELRYADRRRPPERPARALVLAKHSSHVAAVAPACAEAGLPLDLMGPGVGPVSDALETVLLQYDVVFATARMALEAAFVGCAVVVCDHRGFAGMLSASNVADWRRWNFGQGLLDRPTRPLELSGALSRYDAADAGQVTDHLRREARLSDQIEDLLVLYQRAIDELRTAPPNVEAEAAAMGRFLENALPTLALDRPWRRMVTEMSGPHADPVIGAMVRLRDDVLNGVAQALVKLGPDAHAPDVGRALAPTRLQATEFQSAEGRTEAGVTACPLDGRSGILVYGPYEQRAPGRYRVTFDVALEDADPGGSVVFEVAVDAGAIVELTVSTASLLQARSAVLEFELTAAADTVEYRISAAGFSSGTLLFGGVSVNAIR